MTTLRELFDKGFGLIACGTENQVRWFSDVASNQSIDFEIAEDDFPVICCSNVLENDYVSFRADAEVKDFPDPTLQDCKVKITDVNGYGYLFWPYRIVKFEEIASA